jgi:TRAP-type uncharacterized transport system fused permease subunit
MAIIAFSIILNAIADLIFFVGVLLKKLGTLADFFDVTVSYEFLAVVCLLLVSRRSGWVLTLLTTAFIFYLEGWSYDPGLRLELPDLQQYFPEFHSASIPLSFH